MTRKEADGIIAEVVRDICELPNRTSPDNAPDMMLVTEEELSIILVEALSPWIDGEPRG